MARSSRVRRSDPERERKLAKQINKIEGDLLATAPEHLGESFDLWVVPHLRQQHSDNAGSLDKNLNSWSWLSGYLREISVVLPREVTRSHVFGYVDWRCSRKKEKSGKFPLRNTALYDLRILGKILQEAVERGFVPSNPARRLKLKRDAVKVKPERRDPEIAKLRAVRADRPEWMRSSFGIGIHTGLRFQETRIDLFTNVDFETETIFIEDPKGGKKRAFSVNLPPGLRPLLEGIRDRGQRWTWTHERQKNELPRSLQWRPVFDAARLPAPFSFHCSRVTYITRGCRAGVPETIMMLEGQGTSLRRDALDLVHVHFEELFISSHNSKKSGGTVRGVRAERTVISVVVELTTNFCSAAWGRGQITDLRVGGLGIFVHQDAASRKRQGIEEVERHLVFAP